MDITHAGRTASNRKLAPQIAGGCGGSAFGTWCQSTILPPRMRKTAVARWPGPSQALVGRLPRRKVAVTTAPLVERATILPEQGRPAFQTTASACVRSLSTTGPWMTCAPGAKRSAAAWLSPPFSALLHARTTLSGDVFPPPQPASRTRRRAMAIKERTTRPTIVSARMDFALSDDQREIQALIVRK